MYYHGPIHLFLGVHFCLFTSSYMYQTIKSVAWSFVLNTREKSYINPYSDCLLFTWTDARRPVPRLWIRSAEERGEHRYENRNTTTTTTFALHPEVKKAFFRDPVFKLNSKNHPDHDALCKASISLESSLS